MDKIQEASLKNLVSIKIREAKKSDNPLEAITELREIDTAGVASLSEKIETAISDLQEKISISKTEAEIELKEKNVKIEELNKKIEEITSKYEKAKAIVEKLGLEEGENPESLKENISKLQETVDDLIEQKDKMKNDLKIYKEVVTLLLNLLPTIHLKWTYRILHISKYIMFGIGYLIYLNIKPLI